ncbi:hypothetical protein OBBRIDRAFT_838696 [Obba rivulosa]|uniref:Uncharacterized protein n=1 Tax=Obba rivulosa TaxID=1052685 RepID=A0A8E2APU4_9APHY|nr:hypothetical protein OBBRIDRAFT_838696 [Obba rivulosa]
MRGASSAQLTPDRHDRLRLCTVRVGRPTLSGAPVGPGPSMREELLAHYPAKFTWQQLETGEQPADEKRVQRKLPPIPADALPCFIVDAPPELICMND